MLGIQAHGQNCKTIFPSMDMSIIKSAWIVWFMTYTTFKEETVHAYTSVKTSLSYECRDRIWML